MNGIERSRPDGPATGRGRPRGRGHDEGSAGRVEDAREPERGHQWRRGALLSASSAPFEDARRPDLVLLDLNLPRLSGREVLAITKADPDLLRIPVVILTTSDAEEDVLRSYDLHANAYVAKPVGFESFVSVVRQIDEFFLTIVRLPPR